MKKDLQSIELLFGATSNFLPYAVVTALSVIENAEGRPVNIYFLYADIVTPISDEYRNNIFEITKTFFKDLNVRIYFYDVSDKLYLLEGQNIGMWGKEVSLTHYFYLLAPLFLPKKVEKVIYLDTDMIVNCNISDAFNIDMENFLIAMGAPRGYEEMGDDVSNSGFVMLNLKQWRKENTLSTILEFGRNLPRGRFCDQFLLYNYFTKNNSERLMLLDKNYNIFPQLFNDIDIKDIKILHYTGYNSIKPWNDKNFVQRGGFLWWKFARKTPFYESFICSLLKKEIKKQHRHGFWWHLKHMKF